MKAIVIICLLSVANILHAQPEGWKVPEPYKYPKDKTIYLWPEGKMPAVTEYKVNDNDWFDEPDFRPNIVEYLVEEGKEIKGAVMVCAGGAFLFRSDEPEGYTVAQKLSELGYQAFVVNYRVRPYTMEEGSLDLARAIRYVRMNAEHYGIDPKNIASVGFSAGGILCGDEALNFDGKVNGTKLDADYTPDAQDAVCADVAAIGMIYSFYGRLSHGTTDVEYLKSGNLPPTFYAYGTKDPFYKQFIANANAAREAGLMVEEYEFKDYPHGFGLGGDIWVLNFDKFLQKIFK